MNQVTWTIDERVLERLAPSRRPFDEIIRSRGHKVRTIVRHDNGSYDNFVPPAGECSVLFGSHPFVKAMSATGMFQPGGLGVNERTQASSYMSNLPLEWFLNKSGNFMTWAMFRWYLANSIGSLPWNDFTGKLFIRPNSGFKTFAGMILDINKDLDLDIRTLEEHSGVVAETMILVNYPVELEGEFRFVIADGKVIAGSEYRWDGRLDIRIDYPEICKELAEKVAQHSWQVDIAYTCDVALVDGEARLVEINGFSCAGLYACDLEAVVDGVSAAALKEFYDYQA